jgi:hypothetical protein
MKQTDKIQKFIHDFRLQIDYERKLITVDKHFLDLSDKIYAPVFKYRDVDYALRFIANVVLHQDKLDTHQLKELPSEVINVANKLKNFKVYVANSKKNYCVSIYYKGREYQTLTDVKVVWLWCLYDLIVYLTNAKSYLNLYTCQTEGRKS